MRSITELKSLKDIRTTISTHARSLPRQKGSSYLEILARGLEKQRLDSERDWLTRRQYRVDKRLLEIRELMAGLLAKVGKEVNEIPDVGESSAKNNPTRQGNGSGSPGWKKMTINY